MTREIRPCLTCGHPVTFIHVDEKDIGKDIATIRATVNPYEMVVGEDDLGWWDATCENCWLYTPSDMVEARIDKQLRGYFVVWDYPDEILNWLRIFLRECPEARQVAKEEVCDIATD